MSLLLDTHVLLWFLGAPDRLRKVALKRIEDPNEIVFVSSVSAWEIEIKRSLGKVRAPLDLVEQLRDKRFLELPLHLRHVEAMQRLPALHRDPFDRALVAQALADRLCLVTADEKIRAYAVQTLRA
jgi:PIN domain nuclease of toxin-antitoxin system